MSYTSQSSGHRPPSHLRSGRRSWQSSQKARRLRAAHVAHEPLKRLRQHTGHALGADLLLVREDADRGLLRGHSVKNTCKLCIRADAVVVTVGRDEAAVKADVARLPAGTTSSSAEIKSSSVMPYCAFKYWRTLSLKRSEQSLSSNGFPPSSTFKLSLGMASLSGFLPCSRPRCGKRSLMMNWGSSSLPPMWTSTFERRAARPRRAARGGSSPTGTCGCRRSGGS